MNSDTTVPLRGLGTEDKEQYGKDRVPEGLPEVNNAGERGRKGFLGRGSSQ